MPLQPVTHLRPLDGGPSPEARPPIGTRSLRVDLINLGAFLGDLAAVSGGLLLGYWIRFHSGWIPLGWGVEPDRTTLSLSLYSRLMLIGAGFLVVTFLYLGLYAPKNLLSLRRTVMVILRGTLFWFAAYLGISLAIKFDPPISRIYVLSSYLACNALLVSWRCILRLAIRRDIVANELRQNILFVGWNHETAKLTEVVRADNSQPYRVVGYVPLPVGLSFDSPPEYVPKLGTYDDLADILKARLADVVVLADLDADVRDIVALSNLCERELVQFKVIPSYFQILVSGLKLDSISGVPIMGISELPLDHLPHRILKRCMDVVGAILGLIISIPLMLFFGILIYLESPGPVLYRQIRMGRNGRTFEIIKLRSMRLGAEETGSGKWTTRNDPRRLQVGAFMRAWNIDEVPQF